MRIFLNCLCEITCHKYEESEKLSTSPTFMVPTAEHVNSNTNMANTYAAHARIHNFILFRFSSLLPHKLYGTINSFLHSDIERANPHVVSQVDQLHTWIHQV